MVNICILAFLRISFPICWLNKKTHFWDDSALILSGKELRYFQNNVIEFSIIFKNLFWRWIKYQE